MTHLISLALAGTDVSFFFFFSFWSESLALKRESVFLYKFKLSSQVWVPHGCVL